MCLELLLAAFLLSSTTGGNVTVSIGFSLSSTTQGNLFRSLAVGTGFMFNSTTQGDVFRSLAGSIFVEFYHWR